MRTVPSKIQPQAAGRGGHKSRNGCALYQCPDRTVHTSTPIPPPTTVPKVWGTKHSDSFLWTGRDLKKDRADDRRRQHPGGTGFKRGKAGAVTHRGHRQAAVPVEKGVRHGYTEALSGTAVLGGEGHFSLLDTVGDREGRSSIGGLLGRG